MPIRIPRRMLRLTYRGEHQTPDMDFDGTDTMKKARDLFRSVKDDSINDNKVVPNNSEGGAKNKSGNTSSTAISSNAGGTTGNTVGSGSPGGGNGNSSGEDDGGGGDDSEPPHCGGAISLTVPVEINLYVIINNHYRRDRRSLILDILVGIIIGVPVIVIGGLILKIVFGI